MKEYILLLLFLSCVFNISAQHTVSGTVTNENGEKLELALVYLMGTDYASTTDEKGFFEIKGIEEGLYKIKFTFLGYENYVEEILVDGPIQIDISLRGVIFDIDEIVIQSTWSDEKSPFSFSNYKKKDLEDKNIGQDVPYVLQFTPSVVVSSDAGNGIGYTGIRVRGTDPSRTNVTINGIPLNDAESQLVFWVDLPDFMSSVSEVQIERGVGSSTVGTSAFGANINLSTKAFNINPHAEINSSIGSFNTQKIGVNLGTGLMNNTVSIDGRYSLIKSDGYIDRASSDLQSYMISAQYLRPKVAIRGQIMSGSEVTYQAWNGLPQQFLTDNRTYNTAGTEKPGDPYSNEVDNYTQTHAQLHYDREISSQSTLNVALHYTRGYGYFENYFADQDLNYYYLVDNSGDLFDVVTRRWLSNHFFGTRYSYQYFSADGKSKLIFSGGLNRYLGDHYGDAVWNSRDYNSLDSLFAGRSFPARYYENRGEKDEINHFVRWTYDITSRLNGYLDLQHRYVRYTIDGILDDRRLLEGDFKHHFLNPKLGLNLQINSAMNSYASFAIASREPNRNDYVDAGDSPDVRPERLSNLELGWKYQEADFYLQANAYLMAYKDQLVLTGRINDVGEYIRENVDQSLRRGLEFIVAKELFSGFNWNANLNLSQNKILDYSYFRDNWDTGEQEETFFETTDIAFSPPVIVGSEINYQILQFAASDQSLNIGLRSKFVGEQFIDNSSNPNAKLDSYFTNDLSIKYRINPKWSRGITLQFTVFNLTDEKFVSNAWTYRFISPSYNPVPDDPYAASEGGNDYNLTGFYPQAGRNFMLSCQLNF